MVHCIIRTFFVTGSSYLLTTLSHFAHFPMLDLIDGKKYRRKVEKNGLNWIYKFESCDFIQLKEKNTRNSKTIKEKSIS